MSEISKFTDAFALAAKVFSGEHSDWVQSEEAGTGSVKSVTVRGDYTFRRYSTGLRELSLIISDHNEPDGEGQPTEIGILAELAGLPALESIDNHTNSLARIEVPLNGPTMSMAFTHQGKAYYLVETGAPGAPVADPEDTPPMIP